MVIFHSYVSLPEGREEITRETKSLWFTTSIFQRKSDLQVLHGTARTASGKFLSQQYSLGQTANLHFMSWGGELCPGSRISLFFGLPQMFEGNDSIRSLFLIRPRCSIPGTSGIPNFCAMWVPQFERLKANRLCHSTRWLNQRGTEKYFKPMDL